MGELVLAILRDAAVAVVVAVAIAVAKVMFPALRRHMPEARNVDDEPRKEFVRDVGMYFFRMVLLAWAVSLPAVIILFEEGSPESISLRDARWIGGMMPDFSLSSEPFQGDAMKLVLLLIVPVVALESLLVWPLRTWARQSGYASRDFTQSLRLFALFTAPIIVFVHLFWVLSDMSYATIWMRTGIGVAVVFVLSLIGGSQQKD